MHDDDTPPTPTGDLAVDIAGLTRVEGEGRSGCRSGTASSIEAHLEIFEAPRYFERLVVGRTPDEVIDIVARICGICPVAYQMTAVHAFEDALGIEIDPAVRALRRLLYCGEWIESHALHVYLLHCPGLPRLRERDRAGQGPPRRPSSAGCALKKAGNQIVALIGGRPIHPVIGPGRRLLARVRRGPRCAAPGAARRRRSTIALADRRRWSRASNRPPFEREPRLVALRHPTEYPMNEGRIVSTDGLDIAPADWPSAFARAPGRRGRTPCSRAAATSGPTCSGRRSRITLAGERAPSGRRAALAGTGLARRDPDEPVSEHRRPGDRARRRRRRGARHRRRLLAAGRAADRLDSPARRRRLGDRGAARADLPLATSSTSAGSCDTPRSCRRRARTRRPSKPTSRRSRRRSCDLPKPRRRIASSS